MHIAHAQYTHLCVGCMVGLRGNGGKRRRTIRGKVRYAIKVNSTKQVKDDSDDLVKNSVSSTSCSTINSLMTKNKTTPSHPFNPPHTHLSQLSFAICFLRSDGIDAYTYIV